MDVISSATDKCLIASCHDCSEGGLGVAIAEMAFAGGLGADIQLDAVPLGEAIERNDFILFSESNSRFIIEVEPRNQKKFEALMKGQNTALIGEFNDTQRLNISGINKKTIISIDIEQLKEAWQRPLKW